MKQKILSIFFIFSILEISYILQQKYHNILALRRGINKRFEIVESRLNYNLYWRDNILKTIEQKDSGKLGNRGGNSLAFWYQAWLRNQWINWSRRFSTKRDPDRLHEHPTSQAFLPGFDPALEGPGPKIMHIYNYIAFALCAIFEILVELSFANCRKF